MYSSCNGMTFSLQQNFIYAEFPKTMQNCDVIFIFLELCLCTQTSFATSCVYVSSLPVISPAVFYIAFKMLDTAYSAFLQEMSHFQLVQFTKLRVAHIAFTSAKLITETPKVEQMLELGHCSTNKSL